MFLTESLQNLWQIFSNIQENKPKFWRFRGVLFIFFKIKGGCFCLTLVALYGKKQRIARKKSSKDTYVFLHLAAICRGHWCFRFYHLSDVCGGLSLKSAVRTLTLKFIHSLTASTPVHVNADCWRLKYFYFAKSKAYRVNR